MNAFVKIFLEVHIEVEAPGRVIRNTSLGRPLQVWLCPSFTGIQASKASWSQYQRPPKASSHPKRIPWA